VQIFGSHDNYQVPLDLDLQNLAPREAHTVSFEGLDKVGPFEGDIQFKLVAEATLFPVKVLPSTVRRVKKGGRLQINWFDHQGEGPYDIELRKNGNLVHSIATGVAGTSHIAELPQSLKRGAYALQVTPAANPAATSEEFPVRLKGSPTGLWVASGVAVGGAVAVLLLLNGDSSTEPGESGLPLPPGVPE
jgi:hypothetical protein